MTTSSPPALSHNPLVGIAADVRSERAAAGGFPRGASSFSAARTHRLAVDPLPVLLECYERYGPVFSVRILHALQVFVLGPEANHQVTVANARNFRWRDGGFGELEPLLGDGLLTTDGEFHRRARTLLLPAFHTESVAGAISTMVGETDAALGSWWEGEILDVYAWTRELAMRIAMRALLGLDPDDGDTGARAASAFERALSFYGTEFALRVLRGPGSPWARMHRARAELDEIVFAEIGRRRREQRGEGLLAMLMAATDQDGGRLSDTEVRDQAVTLLFAGHDTTTSTVSFLLYELARNPHELDLVLLEQDEVLAGSAPTAAQLTGGMPRLDMVLDEVLRLYPPAWIGPRRSIQASEIAGVAVPGGVPVNYCSWASHRLPEVFPDPERFDPERFSPGRKVALPKGAYVPFGGGSRTCLGMRFGQLEVKAIATMVLQRFALELLPGRTMTVRQMPTLSPRGGLRMRVRPRVAPRAIA